MMYKKLDFKTFDKAYIQNPDGYLPVWFSLNNDYDKGEYESNQLVLRLDMTVPYRLTDGKVRFLEVPVSNLEEYNKVEQYIDTVRELLIKSLMNNHKNSFNNNNIKILEGEKLTND